MDRYLEQLQSDDGAVRLRALLALADTGDRSHLPELARLALTDSYEHITITGFGGVSEHPSHESTFNFVAASQAMIGIYQRLGIRAGELARLIRALDGPTAAWPAEGWLASTILRALGATSLPALAQALRRRSPLVRANAARVLSAMGPIAQPLLEIAVTHRDPAVRAGALRGLLHSEPATADLPRMAQLYRDPAAAVRAEVLKHITTADLMRLAEQDAPAWFAQALALLDRGLADPDEGVRRQALEGMLRLQPGPDPDPRLRSLRLVRRYGSAARPDRLLPLLSAPHPQIQLLALKLAGRGDPLAYVPALSELARSADLSISLGAVRLLHKARRLLWLDIVRAERRAEVRRLAVELGTSDATAQFNHLGLLLSIAALLPHEADLVIKQQLIAYILHQARTTVAGSDQWKPSRWHELAVLMSKLQADAEIGTQAAELYRDAEAGRQAAYQELLAQPPSLAQIHELGACGDGRALPLLEQIPAAEIIERSPWAGDDNGAGGQPYPESYPLAPAAEAAIAAIRGRLNPPVALVPQAALTPELDRIFRGALQREVRGQLQLPEQLRFNQVHELRPDGPAREDDRRASRVVRYTLRYASEPYLDYYEEAEDYSLHRRIDARGAISVLEEFRGQWGQAAYPDDPERTERERRATRAHNTRVQRLLREKGFL